MLKLAKISTKSEISIWHHQIGKILAKDAYGDIFAKLYHIVSCRFLQR